jgi:hypothetical protein
MGWDGVIDTCKFLVWKSSLQDDIHIFIGVSSFIYTVHKSQSVKLNE